MNPLQELADVLERADYEDTATPTWGQLRALIGRAADYVDSVERDADD